MLGYDMEFHKNSK